MDVLDLFISLYLHSLAPHGKKTRYSGNIGNIQCRDDRKIFASTVRQTITDAGYFADLLEIFGNKVGELRCIEKPFKNSKAGTH